ncbi:hypothetical protein [Devosia aquimaris]|uniref:hypothetical protein n=1 Tax=Devosia aquimaris TaxID=2866214 RepID=UPI001CD127B3|nr:hypothetical protein [Devosia sp. CJK-A8-3]
MTYNDAANLIIATAWDANPKDAVDLVLSYGDLTARRVREEGVDAVMLGQTFGKALAEMVESVAAQRVDFSASDRDPNHKATTVYLYGPTPRAEIRLQLADRVLTFEYGPMFDGSLGDLRRTVQFTQVTLGFVGEAIADGFSR